MPLSVVQAKGQAIHQFRTRLGLSQDELALRSDVSKRTIERLEKGATTKPSTIIMVAAALQCQPDDLQEAASVEVGSIRSAAARLVAASDARLVAEEHKEQVRRRAETVTLAALLCPANHSGGVELRCLTKSRAWDLRLRMGTTLAELAQAIARQYDSGTYSRDTYYYFCDKLEQGQEYDETLTVDDLQRASIRTLYVYSRSRVGRALGIAPSLLPRLLKYAEDFKQGGYMWRRALCRVIVWLYSIPPLASRACPTWMLKMFSLIAQLYAETNTATEFALKLAMLIERHPKAESWQYRDTIAWVLYRSGSYRGAYATIAHDLPDEALYQPEVLYHLYFICQSVNDTETATLVHDRLAMYWKGSHWKNLEPFFFELECTRVRTNNDTWMP